MKNLWRLHLELTFPATDEDSLVRYEGDAEVDFASRAVERIRPHLEALTEEIGGNYFILHSEEGGLAKRVQG